ncbi:MAG TPA: Gfo/Idh/MocA family oxidoreductase [Phycisphaerae bacterium]|nr:Gfo/Idh/MocA family oxidoreductase [Phycisphaerae bacterium]
MKAVRLAIIGCGGFVRSHVGAICDHVKGFRFVGLVDTVQDHAQRLLDNHPIGNPPVYRDYKRMLKEVGPDAVIVSTPHTLHFRHCYDALGAGAHVMVEKPMVTNADDARKLVAQAKAKKRILQIAIQGTYTDTFAYARKLLTDGTMGELQLVTGVLAQGWLAGTRGSWRQDPKLAGGGQLYDSCAHVLSAMMFLVNSPVKEVFCWTDNKGVRVDINAVGTVRFANGAMAAITSGGNCPAWKSHLTLQGDKALMEISPHGGDFHVSGAGLKKPITATPKGWKIPSVTPARNFHDAIHRKAKPRCGGRLGILLADLMDALYESARTGKPAKVARRAPKE